MKIKLFCVLVITFLFCSVQSSNNLKSDAKKSTLKFKKAEVTSQMRTMWENLFTQKKVNPCKLNDPIKMLAVDPNYLGLMKGKNKFWWVKAWGYDNAAYLFDYLDPVFRSEFVATFQSLYDTVWKLPLENPNPVKKVLVKGPDGKFHDHSKNNATLLGYDPWRDPYDLKNMNPKQASKIDFRVYNLSINTVQLNQAIKKFGWHESEKDINPGKKMVVDHDFNNDGRLSPREFIIAALRNNDGLLGNPECRLCFENLIPKIDAMFTFMDCDNNGLVSSEDMYEALPNLRRSTNLWNYFDLADQAKIRSHVTNDFVLKSMRTVNGNLTLEEFRRGILYGFWDRQTDDYQILDDDSRTLKHLRWRGNMVDITAERYIRALEEAKLKKAREMAAQFNQNGQSQRNQGPLSSNDVFK